MKLAGFLVTLLPAIPICASAPAESAPILSWDASPDPAVAGYNVYYGGASGNYTNVISVGNVTNAAISGLVEGATYYFAATAVDTNGVESVFSAELSYTMPAVVAKLQISAIMPSPILRPATRQGLARPVSIPPIGFHLACAGLVGHAYEIQATTNLIDWAVIAIRTVDSSGSFEFTDYDATNYPARFYRTLEIP
ncbi:MAG: hypothetical protein ACREFE_07240 [Limisphaerales bacterium]